MRCPGLLLLVAAAACATGRGAARTRATPVVGSLRHSIDSMLDDGRFRSAQWGVLVVAAENGDTLYSRNAGKLFMPASNQKILTGATALHLLGPSYRFVTTVAVTSAPVDGVVNGDLLLLGTGDPSVSNHMRGNAMIALREIADSLAGRGIRRVTGSLRSGLDAFPDATLGYGWAWDDLDFDYSAGVDELFFNEGFTQVVVRGGTLAGDSTEARTRPARTYPRIRNLVLTAPRSGTPPRNHVDVQHDSTDAGRVIVRGTVAPGDSIVVAITFRDQAAAYLEAFREAMTERGIVVDGGVGAGVQTLPIGTDRAGDEPRSLPPPAASGTPLFSVVSPSLREILPPFLKPSQNQIGEILLKTLGRARTGIGTADSGAAVVRQQLLEWGAAPDGFVVRDGSGLSRHDVVTPETIVRVLTAMRRDTAFAAFYDALPVAGVDGTIANRMRGTPAQGNVHAKTGSLDMVRSLSGYVTTADGRLLVFSVLSNNWIVPSGQITAVQDAIAVRLARLRLDRH